MGVAGKYRCCVIEYRPMYERQKHFARRMPPSRPTLNVFFGDGYAKISRLRARIFVAKRC